MIGNPSSKIINSFGERVLLFGSFSAFLAALFKPGDEQGMYEWLVKPQYVILGSKVITAISLVFIFVAVAVSVLRTMGSFKVNRKAASLNLTIFLFTLVLQTISFFSPGGGGGALAKIVVSFSVSLLFTSVFSISSFRFSMIKYTPPIVAGAIFVLINCFLFLVDRNGVISTFGRMYGTTDHPNFFGVWCSTVAVLFFGVFNTPPELKVLKGVGRFVVNSRVALVVMAVSILGVLLSGSRTALLIFVVGVVVTQLLNAKSIKRSVLILSLFVAVFAVYFNFHESLYGVAEVRSLSTENNRSGAWGGMLDKFETSPVYGVGLQNIGYSENSYLRALTAAGILGGGGFALYIFFIFYAVMASKRKFEGKLFSGVIIALLTGAMLEGYLVDAFSFPSLVFQYIATACISAVHLERSSEPVRSIQQSVI